MMPRVITRRTAEQPEISVVLPCRNEEQALGFCLNQIKTVLAQNQLAGEIIVSDSSSDRSPAIAKEFGAVLVKHNKLGYGNAYLEGYKAVSGRYIFMADADGSYDFAEIPHFLKHLNGGYDFVIGNRFGRPLAAGAMPWSHQYIGNPLLSAVFRLFFKSTVTDVHCGMRAISREALERLDLKAPGMEFASEMLIEVARKNLSVKQVPIDYLTRRGESKLRSFPDGWRHLKLMIRQAL